MCTLTVTLASLLPEQSGCFCELSVFLLYFNVYLFICLFTFSVVKSKINSCSYVHVFMLLPVNGSKQIVITQVNR